MLPGMKILFLSGAAAVLLWAVVSCPAFAAGVETDIVPTVDPAPCLAAIADHDADKVVDACGILIDNDKTEKADRIKALIARAGVFIARDQPDRAIADYDVVLRLDPTLADIYNTRGELWWKKGDRPKALADFTAALKLNPDHASAKGNFRSLAQELERIGALMAVAGKPSFNCATARRPVEKAICADPELADLDREINAASAKAVRDAAKDSRSAGHALQREQDEFLSHRNAGFGQPGYDLKKVMKERLDKLNGVARQ
jgi:tetratricopeptide (TPR) repeat protein